MFRDDIDERLAKYKKDEKEIPLEEFTKSNPLELSSTPPDEAEALRDRI